VCPARRAQQLSLTGTLQREAPLLRSRITAGWEQPLEPRGRRMSLPLRQHPAFGVCGRTALRTAVGSTLAAE